MVEKSRGLFYNLLVAKLVIPSGVDFQTCLPPGTCNAPKWVPCLSRENEIIESVVQSVKVWFTYSTLSIVRIVRVELFLHLLKIMSSLLKQYWCMELVESSDGIDTSCMMQSNLEALPTLFPSRTTQSREYFSNGYVVSRDVRDKYPIMHGD